MRIAVIGAGPAGLYFAYLVKRRRPDIEVRVFEQNSSGATFGFGVVFSERALEFLEGDDPATYAAIAPYLEMWNDITLDQGGDRLRIDGIGFAAIGRLALLQIMQTRLRSVGVEPAYQHAVTSLEDIEADIVVGADGVNSLVRRTFAKEFGAGVTHFTNRFAWFGTTLPYDTLTQTFRKTDLGHFNAHHYRYSKEMSTFVVEVDEPTFFRAGFDRMAEPEAITVCERAFADVLGGHKLVSNNSIWRQFPIVRNERWSHGRYVLLGDALHTAHFSIGSGTRLAMEDAIALDKALVQHSSEVPAAFRAYEAARRPILEKLVAAANASGAWYEKFAEHMRLAPIDFAMSYITRSGRVDMNRLHQISPRFAARYEREHVVAQEH
jgi:2-polyprenyl-6-methoxyphenol hydroxylase-like FAD-dependent oxidoreductase